MAALLFVDGCVIVLAMLGARCCLLAIAPISMVAAVVRADPAPSARSKVQAAKAYVDAGLVAQQSGDYDTAITLYEKAYELVPHPVLLFNMAQAHRLAGRVERALKLYRKYLEAEPRGPEARTARELVLEIEALKANHARETAAAREAGAARESGAEEPAGRARKTRPGDASPGDASGETQGAGNDPMGADQAPAGASSGTDRDGGSAESIGSEIPVRHERGTHGSLPRAWIGIGGSFARRRLTYDTRQGFANAPLPFQTAAPAVRIEGEVYPFALSEPEGALAGLGIATMYDQTFALSVQAQSLPEEVPFDQAHYQIGLRYRFGVGESSAVTLGIDYTRRHSLVDRSTGTGMLVDAPDVDYAAFTPTLAVHIPVATAATIFANIDAPLVYDTGSIQDYASYGKSTVYGIEVMGGLAIALSQQIGLRLALEYSEFLLVFDGAGEMSSNRDGDTSTQDVNSATDRTLGFTASIGLTY